jgi:hypothetical protein
MNDIDNGKAMEEKLRLQLVEGEEKQKQSQTELESTLTQKIKSLDEQNDQYFT